MSALPQPSPAPAVRTLWRWGIPFHYVAPALTAVLSIGLLGLGGLPAAFGGWILAVGLPIAIGAFTSISRFALVPVGIWAAWVGVGLVSGPDAALANTPIPVAIALAAIGAGGTLLAQRAIFPASELAARHALGAGNDGADADAAEEPQDTMPSAVLLLDDELGDDDVFVDAIEVDEEDEVGDAPPAAETGDAEPAAVVDEAEAVEAPEPVEEPEAVQPGPAAAVTPAETPRADDPPDLDEGGHVTEFEAISEEALKSAPPLPPQTRAGQRAATRRKG